MVALVALIKKPDIRLVNARIERYRRLVGSAIVCPTGDTKNTPTAQAR